MMRFLPLFSLLLAVGVARAEPWTVDDVVLTPKAGSWRISPDGKWALWIKATPNEKANKILSHLMLSSLDNDIEIQLTRGDHSSSQPRWSPDGKRIAFLSDRPAPESEASKRRKSRGRNDEDKEDHTQLWIMNAFGGEPWALTEIERDVDNYGWVDDDTILFLAKENKSFRDIDLKEKKDPSEVVEDAVNEPPVRLWKLAVEDKKVERFSDNPKSIEDLWIAPGGKHAVIKIRQSLSFTFDNRVRPALYLLNLETRAEDRIFEDRKFNVSRVYWQADGRAFYAVSQFTTDPNYLQAYVLQLHHMDVNRKTSAVDLAWPRGLADEDVGFTVMPDGFLALLADGVRHRLARYVRQGEAWMRHELDKKNVHSLAATRDGKKLLYDHSSAQQPPRTFLAELKDTTFGEERVLVDLTPDLWKKKRAAREVVRWKGADGDEVEGLLLYPHDYEKGKKYPLVVMIHGGPFWADFDIWDDDWAYIPNLMCSRGAFVFKPNYHGSSNYGLPWAESIAHGKYYSLPVVDIEKGIDHLVDKGLIDAKKIGLSGWSNGAILTMSLITRRHYQAAAAGAGGSEWVGDWGVCEFGMAFSNYYIGKAPYENPEAYRQNAPFYDLPKNRTPLILFQGSDDRVVAAHHGWLQWRALQQIGKSDVRFLLFHGEKHRFDKLSHRRRKVEEELAWFDKHLFGTLQVKNPALKEDSPLARALQVRSSARDGRLLGEKIQGVLVPETVEFKKLHLGRFEVTRAQFAQFAPKYQIEPGTENFPANGIELQQARDYCAWLSKTTGQVYRLPTAKEMEAILDDVSGDENTLDAWAGYKVNPEDKKKLAVELARLSGPAPLLKEVGSFASADSKVAIFDLGGNVAEWTDDGGEPLGGSAERTADEARRKGAAAAYWGLRVVRDSK